MLAVGFSYYQDLQSIKRSVPSFIDGVDLVFAIDGKYEGHPGQNDCSNDGSTEYLESFDKIIIDKFTGHEYNKRNRYLQLSKKYDCDYLLIIDSDEFVMKADWDLFRKNMYEVIERNKNHSFFGVPFIVDGSGGICHFPRLWYKPYCIEYAQAHCIFRDNRTGMITTSGGAAKKEHFIEGIILSMDDTLRSKEQLANTVTYQRKMIEMERSIRQSFNY